MPGATAKLTVEQRRDLMEVIEVEDFGKPFDAEQYEAPNFDAVPDHGYGIFLVKTIADNLSVDTARERGTRWTIVKYRPGRGPAVGKKDEASRS